MVLFDHMFVCADWFPPLENPEYGHAIRDGIPLPGLSPRQVISQLTYRVFGPLRRLQIEMVLDHPGNHPDGNVGPPSGHIPHRVKQGFRSQGRWRAATAVAIVDH